jgi:YCII-related domain
MKRFVAIYLGSASALAQWKATDDGKRKEQEKAGMDAWMKWAKENEASIVDLGSPLGKTKRINTEGISDTKNQITGYTIVQAESHEAAAELFANHPHFMIFPGDSVEVMECLPMPSRM